MAEISSINFKKSKPNNLAHNERITPPSYLIGSETLQNEVNRNMSEALALKQSMINKAIETYNKNKKPKAPPFKATSYEWSAVVNLKPSSTMQDLEKLAEHLQEKYGFQCYQIAIHRDEGHFENGEKIFNHHAHLEFITLDRDTGRNKFNRRDIKFQTLRDIQTETAEILQMQRGIDKRLSGAKRIEPRAYAKMKESEKGERKAMLENLNFKHKLELDEVNFQANKKILEYKDSKDNEILELKTALRKEETEHKATKKQLDELFEARRKEMIAEGDNTKKQYDEFRQLKKELCNDENVTLEQALKKIKELRESQELRKKQEQTIKKLNEKIKELDEKLAENAKNTPKTAENEFLQEKALIPLKAKINNLKNNKESKETQIKRIDEIKNFMQELETKAPTTYEKALNALFSGSKSTFDKFIIDYKAKFTQQKSQNQGISL